MAVGYQCASTLKDIQGTIVNQGDSVVYREYDRMMMGIVTSVKNESIMIKPSPRSIWMGTRVIQGHTSDRFILVLKKFNEK